MSRTTSRSTCDFNQQFYEFWLKHSDNFQAIEQCLNQHLPAAVKKLYPRVDNKSFNILSIGAGNGQNDLRILKVVIDCLEEESNDQEIEIGITAIEPNPVHIQDYETSVQENVQNLQETSKKVIKLQLENKTFEEYKNSDHEKKRFDLIHAIHSLGFLEDPSSALKYCFENELKNKGVIAYISSSGNSNEVFPLVASILNKNRPPAQRVYWGSLTETVTLLTPHYESFRFYSTLDVTDISDENSENWSLVLDVITCTEGFCQKANEDVIEEICQLVKESASANNKKGLFLRIENELTVLYKL